MNVWLHRLLLICVLAIVPGPVLAAESPSQFVAAFLDEAFGLFRTDAMTEAERRAALRDLFTKKMDMPHMARFMTMEQVIEAEPQRRQRFESLLAGYLTDSFYSKIAEGASGSVDVAPSSRSSDPGNLAIDSIISKPGSPPEPITWRLRPANGSYKIIDVLSEGISMATMYRATFGAIMLTGGLERLEQMLVARQ
jgi:phospholipid transport system substrate-binding protein